MISVCLASYNGEDHIHEQIKSILDELGPDDELVISDDGSTDSTISIIEAFHDPRIRVLHHQNSSGRPTENFQHALKNAKGDFIFLADQDDVWLPGKCRKMIALLQQYDLVVSNSIVVDENLQPIHPSFFDFLGSGKGIVKNAIKNSYYGSCMAFTKRVLQLSLPFPASREIGHDVWIGLVAEVVGKVLFHDEPLILYRRHNSTFTLAGMNQKSQRSFVVKVWSRVVMLSTIIKFQLNYKLWKKG
ncbi:glycosyltransferase family 2 protein [Chitinophaga varians]|uniref:glycosyltransferase family 2 protein n=1 Tax=Chitinophaga varians TaxID=2202339 RepID=UPI00165F7A57|nr:glycosyltransferase family 2 protein [Chitinophaga varians]MBC9910588.1 glycosyltransferase family 2 protein [Chitinophaga varians]